MDQFTQEFLIFLEKEKEYSHNTVAAYRNDLTQFTAYIRERHDIGPGGNDFHWTFVTSAHILDYLLFLREREYTTSTVARKIAAVKSYFHYLAARQIVGEDPTDALATPKVQKHKPTSIAYEDIMRLLAEPAKRETPQAQRDIALLEVLYATGMRVSEVVALNKGDVGFAPPATVRCQGRRGKERTMPLGPRATRALETYVQAGRLQMMPMDNEEALFLNHRGQRLTRQGLWLIIKKYVEAIGIEAEVTPYTLRHSFAVHLLREGAGLQEVQRLLGHASMSTTQIYTELAGQTDG